MPNSNIFISITMAAATELQEILADDCIYFILNFVKNSATCVCSISKFKLQDSALSHK